MVHHAAASKMPVKMASRAVVPDGLDMARHNVSNKEIAIDAVNRLRSKGGCF